MSDDLAGALVDVRRAYRLLWAYQRRVNDLFHAIDEHLGRHGMRHAGWKPTSFANVPNQAFYRPNKWAWDLFPGFGVQVWWTGTGPHGPVRADAWLYTDDGFQYTRGEPDPKSWETSAEQARSKLWLYVATGPAKPDWAALHAHVETTDLVGAGAFDLPSGAYRVVCLLAGLEELPDADALHARLLAPVDHWLAEAPAITHTSS
jgi:hypothetical protein